MKHRVRTFKWISGILQWEEEFFERLEEAVEHALASGADHAKIYNHETGVVLHEATPAIIAQKVAEQTAETYA